MKRGWRSWKTVLVVVTADHFLHLFDIPSSSNIIRSPAEAFCEMMPKLNFPTSEEKIPQGKPRNHLKGMNPTEYFFVPKCTVTPVFLPKYTVTPVHYRHFEVTGNVVGRFGPHKMRKVTLRTDSTKGASEWLASLRREESSHLIEAKSGTMWN